MAAPIVFFDIAGPDGDTQRRFYTEIFGWEVDAEGRFSVDVQASPMNALLRTDPANVMVYLGVEDVAATLDKVVEFGGAVQAPRFEVPGLVVLGLFTDPAGNHIGLVEMKDGEQVIP